MTSPGSAFRSLDLVFTLDATDPTLRAVLHDLFDGQSSTDAAEVAFSIASEPTGAFVVRVDGEAVLTTSIGSLACAHLLWEINRRAVERSRAGRLLLHASAVQAMGRAALFSGPSGCGKSTIAAALVAAGLDYLTDDVVAIDGVDGAVVPYPKPIGLSPNVARDILGAVPDGAAWHRFMGEEWYVTPAMLGGRSGPAAPPRLIVFPTYAANGNDLLLPVSRAEALVQLAENSFNFTELAPRSVDVLGRTLRECACYRIEFSNPARVVELVRDWLEHASARVWTAR
jgi:hypothetical protein